MTTTPPAAWCCVIAQETAGVGVTRSRSIDVQPVGHEHASDLTREHLGAVPRIVPDDHRAALVAEIRGHALGNGAHVRIGEVIRDHGSPSVGPEPDRVRRHRHHSKRTDTAPCAATGGRRDSPARSCSTITLTSCALVGGTTSTASGVSTTTSRRHPRRRPCARSVRITVHPCAVVTHVSFDDIAIPVDVAIRDTGIADVQPGPEIRPPERWPRRR